MSRAQAVVNTMLGEAYDEHVKAHERIKTWDKAMGSYKKLHALKHKSLDLFKQLGTSMAYERALARVGLTRKDVSHPIYANQIGSIDNYKKTRPVKKCKTWSYHCKLAGKVQPLNREVCPECNEPLETVQVPYSFSDLQKIPRHMLGVETNDGRRVWFDDMIPPSPELDLSAADAPDEPAGDPKAVEDITRDLRQ